VKVRPPPYPDYREHATFPTKEYRVVFWEQDLPPEGSDIRSDEMGWAELTIDLSDVEDVHEAIAWAESNIEIELDRDSEGPHGERVYVLFVKVPEPYDKLVDGDWFLQIAGWDPTVGRRFNLNRRRPS
jgi:hypothetical protein